MRRFTAVFRFIVFIGFYDPPLHVSPGAADATLNPGVRVDLETMVIEETFIESAVVSHLRGRPVEWVNAGLARSASTNRVGMTGNKNTQPPLFSLLWARAECGQNRSALRAGTSPQRCGGGRRVSG